MEEKTHESDSEKHSIEEDNKSPIQNLNKTPEKNSVGDSNYTLTPEKVIPKIEGPTFKTPDKVSKNRPIQKVTENKTPEKNFENNESQTVLKNYPDSFTQNEDEDGMISTTEQARLLIAASKTPSKSINKTPNKQLTPNGKRSLENSPSTPGKFRRVELITLSSPKTKRLKQI